MTWPQKLLYCLPTYLYTSLREHPSGTNLETVSGKSLFMMDELIGPKLMHLLRFASLLCSFRRRHWWNCWLCHLNLGSQVCCWMKIGLAQPFCLRGSWRCQRRVQILHSTFTQHLIWTPQSTPTKGHSFSDLCISGHFWRRQRRVCYGVSKIDILCDTLFTSNRIQEGAIGSFKRYLSTQLSQRTDLVDIKHDSSCSPLSKWEFLGLACKVNSIYC